VGVALQAMLDSRAITTFAVQRQMRILSAQLHVRLVSVVVRAEMLLQVERAV